MRYCELRFSSGLSNSRMCRALGCLSALGYPNKVTQQHCCHKQCFYYCVVVSATPPIESSRLDQLRTSLGATILTGPKATKYISSYTSDLRLLKTMAAQRSGMNTRSGTQPGDAARTEAIASLDDSSTGADGSQETLIGMLKAMATELEVDARVSWQSRRSILASLPNEVSADLFNHVPIKALQDRSAPPSRDEVVVLGDKFVQSCE